MSYIVKGKIADWEIVVGLEVHAQVASRSKLFSRSPVHFGDEQNKNVSFYDIAMPGQLPMLNEFAVRQTVKTGFGINAKINKHSVFDRKHYFYADLPQGYQITQLYYPLVGEGYLDIKLEDKSIKRVGIERIHLEQDAAKLIHDQHSSYSFVDFNRCGTPLMEIVSKPDMSSPDEAVEYMKQLRSIVRSLGTCDGDMEKSNLRCDANISVRKIGDKKLGTRCEVKNLNSMRNVFRAIEYEANRQVEMIEDGGVVEQETRLFDVLSGETRLMRSKADALDYHYFHDPDLLPLELTDEFIEEVRAEMSELPEQRKKRYIEELGISEYDAGVLTSSDKVSRYFDTVIKVHNPKTAVNWITVELFGRLHKLGMDFDKSPVSAEQMVELLNLMKSDVISGKIAKEVLDAMIESGKSPELIVEERGLKQVTDMGEINSVIDEIINANADKVEAYKAGNERLFGFFVGQVMKATSGKANPKIVNEVLKEKLG
jgi:aspartyl-tRNA(Asn)/glutamyl-tRNA(Gln) amidotransferase subunit B